MDPRAHRRVPDHRPADARQTGPRARGALRRPPRRAPRRRRELRHERPRDSARAPSASPAARCSSRPTRSSPRPPRSIAAGGRPRFVDCDPAHDGARPRSLVEAAIGPDTAASIVVHIGGFVTPGDPRHRQALCDDHGVWLVEDAAHAHGSRLDGRIGRHVRRRPRPFSFYPTKVMAAGEGGMIVTDDDRIAEEAAHLPRSGQGRRSSPTCTPDSATTGG